MKKLDVFLRGALWGLVLALVSSFLFGMIFKLTLSCLPGQIIGMLSCIEGSDMCRSCSSGGELIFYTFFYYILGSIVLFPLGFGYWKIRKSRAA